MQKKTVFKNKTKWIYGTAAAIACVLCFAMGVSVPLLVENSSQSDLKKLNNILNILENQWYYGEGSGKQTTELVENAIIGMTTLEEDPHTSYFTIEQAQEVSQGLSGSSANAGAGLTYYPLASGNIVIDEIFIDSPAEKAGLAHGDEIVRIGDVVLEEQGADKAVKLIQSSKGKKLEVEVLRDGQSKTLSLTPDIFSSTVSVWQAEDYGIITLKSFSETSGEDFVKAATRLKEAGIDKLILDLRDNGGGYLTAAVDIASTLLPDNTVIMQEKYKDGTIKEIKTNDNIAQVDFDEIIILQNGNSASASEVLIGALKDNLEDQITTVGVTTYGKGTEQTNIPFADGSSLRYTIAQWLTPAGISINGTGFDPDFEVQNLEASTTGFYSMDDGETVEPDTVHVNARPVQIYLQYLGYEPDRTDEYFSYTSSQALAYFQEEAGLSPTGVIDQKTLDALLQAVTAQLNQNEQSDDLQLVQAIALASETEQIPEE